MMYGIRLLIVILLLLVNLRYAKGENGNIISTELKKVVEYYEKSGDKEKLNAVYFLIDNMPKHLSEDFMFVGENGKSLHFNELKYPSYASSLEAFEKLKQQHKINGVSYNYADLDSVTSKLIIENIEFAFKVWKKPWNRNLTFENFCEYILPYRVVMEPLQTWRKTYYSTFSKFYSKVKSGNSKNELCIVINQNLSDWFIQTYGIEKRQESMPLLGPLTLLHRKRGECPDMAVLTTYAMRSVGIPCAVDFTPYWATSSGGHYWNITWDENGKSAIFMGATNDMPGAYIIPRELGKVYRYMYSLQQGSLAFNFPNIRTSESFISSPYIKDVTSEYVRTVDVDINLRKFNQKYPVAFAAVFNRAKWRIVDWGRVQIQGNEFVASFKDLGTGCIYLPMTYRGEKAIPASYPFSVDNNGVINHLKPDYEKKRGITLKEQSGYLIYRPDKEYKLYYWDNRWVLIASKKIGSNAEITFENVPENALLVLIPEYSEGKERIFTIDGEGNRLWW